ncbi:MAG: oligosaccharide flippase family protein [Oscillospiraceae bacterium]|nr:oligosaccharide flippase family protein [Oscillospiraceae bacterium]
MKLDRSSALYATLLLTGTGLISQILGFFYRIALSRLVGAEIMGLYQLIMPVYSVLLSIACVGLTTAVSTLTARYRALAGPEAVRQTLRRCLGAFFAVALGLGAVIIPASDFISVYFLGDARTQLGMILLVPCVLLTGVENLHKHCFYGAGSVRAPAFTELCEQAVRAAAVLGLLLLFLPQNPERTVGLIVAGMVVCEVFSAVTLLALFRKKLGKQPAGPGRAGASWGQIASIALPVGFTALLGNLLGSVNSVLIPQRLVAGGMDAAEAMASFGALCGMTMPMLFLPTALVGAMCLVMTPALARSAALGDAAAIRRRLGRAMLATSVLMMPAMALLAVVGPSLGRLLFADGRAGDYILPLAAGTLLSCYQSVLSSALNGIGKQRLAARNSLLCGGAQLAFTYLTVGLPGVGLKGYVAGFAVSSALGLALNLLSVIRAAGLRPKPFEWLVSPALAALLSGLCANLLFTWLGAQETSLPLSVALCLLTGGLEYLAALQAQGTRLRELFRLGAGPSPE